MHFINVSAQLRILKQDTVSSCNLSKAKNNTEKQKLITNKKKQKKKKIKQLEN